MKLSPAFVTPVNKFILSVCGEVKISYENINQNNDSFLDLGRPQLVKINMLPDDCKFILISWTEANIEARNGPIPQYIFENIDGVSVYSTNAFIQHETLVF